MMQEQDRQRFASIVKAALEVHGRSLSADAVSVWWNVLKRYPIEAVEGALGRVMEVSKYPPKPADVVDALKESDGRPTADEAWQYAIALMDEDTTAWSNREIDRAWGVASTIYRDGDRVGARVAFREAYNRELEEARRAGWPVKWRLSLGHDADQRVEKIREAEAAGLLSHDQATAMLGHEDVPEDRVSGLLEGPPGSREVASEWLSKLRRRVRSGDPDPGGGEAGAPQPDGRRAPPSDDPSVDSAEDRGNA